MSLIYNELENFSYMKHLLFFYFYILYIVP